MKKRPFISVVIPVYNEEKYLPSCLAAFKKQTFTDFELIVVDNNSKDKTAQIAKNFGANVIKEKKQGIIHARERGFREAKTEFIARTDADTITASNWLEVIYQTFKKYRQVVGLTGPWLSSSRIISKKLLNSYRELGFIKMGGLLSGHIYLSGPNMAIRKSAWEKIKVHTDDKTVHEDIDLSCHLAKVGQLLYVPQMQVVISLRRIRKNPLRGLVDYFGEYPYRYLKTVSLHRPSAKIRKIP